MKKLSFNKNASPKFNFEVNSEALITFIHVTSNLMSNEEILELLKPYFKDDLLEDMGEDSGVMIHIPLIVPEKQEQFGPWIKQILQLAYLKHLPPVLNINICVMES